MPAVTIEHVSSRSFTVGQQSTRERVYRVFGTNDEDEVLAQLDSTSPLIYGGLVRETYSANPLDSDDIWEGIVRYSRPEDDPEYTFDTGGGTQRITQSIATIAAYAAGGGAAPDFQGAISVSQDSVEGVDISIPVYNFTETHYFDDSAVTPAFKAALFRLTGRVNNNTFRDFSAGEVLCLGVSGSKRGDTKWPITYRFSASPNATGITVGTITGITKAGWNYMWVRYADVEDTFAYALVKQPIAAYVEQVYYTDNFADLGIGT